MQFQKFNLDESKNEVSQLLSENATIISIHLTNYADLLSFK